jgi:hypothetical protein
MFRRLYEDDNMPLLMGDLARTRAKELDWPIVAKQTIEVYETDSRQIHSLSENNHPELITASPE